MAEGKRLVLEDLSSKLCGPCYKTRTRMFGPHKPEKGPEPTNKFRLHDNYQQLSKCLSCPLCQFLARELLYVKEQDGRYRWHEPGFIPADSAISATVSWAIMIFQHRERYSSLKIEVGEVQALEYNNPVANIQESDFRKGQHNVPRGDPYKKMKGWVDGCLQHHNSCTRDTGQFRPSRLLDLAGEVGDNDIRLIVSEFHLPKNKGRQNHYATLSYCWGPPGLNARTTKENIEERRRRIPLDSLPRTVRDAVQVTRELGIRYLWVDALCIIQEDAEDWGRESAVMGQIYRKSLCTLAAAVGNDCNTGLFKRREAAELSASRMLFIEGGQSDRGLILQPSLDHWYSSVELSTLSTRGWVMQERILAARTIFFTEEGIFWQCADRSSSQFNETVSTNWEFKSTSKSARQSKPRFNDLVKDWRAEAQEYSFKSTGKVTTGKISLLAASFASRTRRSVEARPWHNLVFEFTQRDLTQPNDRLRAVEGIANEFAESANDVYVNNGGIWKSDMIGGMAWYRQWNHDSKQLSIAPSWSWASVSGQIISMYQRTGHVVNIAEMNWKNTIMKKLDGQSIFIQELHISGDVCHVKLYRRFDDGLFWAVDSGSEPPPPPVQPKKFLGIFNRQLNWDQLSGIKSADGINGNLGWSGSSSKVLKNHYEIIFDSATENPPIGTEFLCMPLVGAGFQAPSAQVFPSGLILVPADAARKVYRRIGWCFLWAPVPDEKLRKVELVIV